jgi:hypothetical protein
MYQTHYALPRIEQQDGNTISKAHKQGNFRAIGKQHIRLKWAHIQRARRFYEDHISAMHQPGIVHALRRALERLKCAAAIFAHMIDLIANRAADVERCPRRRADPSTAGENGVLYTLSIQEIKGIVAQRIQLVEGHMLLR